MYMLIGRPGEISDLSSRGDVQPHAHVLHTYTFRAHACVQQTVVDQIARELFLFTQIHRRSAFTMSAEIMHP